MIITLTVENQTTFMAPVKVLFYLKKNSLIFIKFADGDIRDESTSKNYYVGFFPLNMRRKSFGMYLTLSPSLFRLGITWKFSPVRLHKFSVCRRRRPLFRFAFEKYPCLIREESPVEI